MQRVSVQCGRICDMYSDRADGLVLTRSFRVQRVHGRSHGWLGPRSEVPLTCTGPHSRTHTVPIKHAVPPLTHTHNMCSAHTRHVHATCTPARSAHTAPIRITCDSSYDPKQGFFNGRRGADVGRVLCR
jgi:hypothetical protein